MQWEEKSPHDRLAWNICPTLKNSGKTTKGKKH